MSLQASPSTRKWGMVALASSTHCTRCLWNWQCHIPACGMSVHLGGACLGTSQCDSSGESGGMFYCIGSFYTCCNGQGIIQGILRNLFKRFWCLKCGDRFPLIWDFITYFVWLFYFHLLLFSYAFIAIFLYILFYISNQRNLNCCIFDVFYSFILLLFYIHGDGSYTVIPLIICYKRIRGIGKIEGSLCGHHVYKGKS